MTKGIRIGGLFRCSIQAIAEYDGPDDEGTVIKCPHCKEEMIVRDGKWEWKREPLGGRNG